MSVLQKMQHVRNCKYNLKIALNKASSAHQCDTSLLFERTEIEWMEKEKQEGHFGKTG